MRSQTEAVIQTFKISLFLLTFVLFADYSSAAQENKITTSANGSIALKIDASTISTFKPVAATTGWKFSYGLKAGAMEENIARFSLFPSSKIQGTLTHIQVENGIDLIWHYVAAKDVEFNSLAVEFNLSIEDFSGATWHADDNKGTFPDKYSKSGLYGDDIKNFHVTTAKGLTFKLTFPSPVRFSIEDSRRWGSKAYKMRFGKVFGKLAKGETYKIEANLTLPGNITYDVDDEVKIVQNADWIPLKPELDIKPGSALDLSVNDFTQRPCGLHGRVIVNSDGHFAFANNPEDSKRFYGANLNFTSQYMSKERVDQLLDRWLRFGYNTLRIHHYEFRLTEPVWESGFDWDKKRVDQLCYLIAGCSKRGIWLTTDLYVSRPVAPEQIDLPKEAPYVKGSRSYVDGKVYKALVQVYEPAFDDFMTFTRQFLNTTNSYTGVRLAEEPALAWINLVNEGPLGATHIIRQLPQWKIAWNKWLAKRYPERKKLSEAIGDLGENESTENNSVNIPKANSSQNYPRARLWQLFMADTEKTFVKRVRKVLRDELNCEALLSNHNCSPHTVADQGTREVFDYVDNHYYIDHPIFEDGHHPPSRCPNTNPIWDGANREFESCAIRLWGKPMTISEFNYSGPGQHRGIGPMRTGALASLQDWDILWRFAYAHSDQEIFQPTPMDYFNLSRDPLGLAADRAAVMLFLRGDLKAAPPRIATVISKEYLKTLSPVAHLGNIKDWSWVTGVGCSIDYIPENAIKIDVTDSREKASEILEAKGLRFTDENGITRSETGEIMLDAKRGVFSIDTSRTAGGYAVEGEVIDAVNAGVKIDDLDYGATVFVTSLDALPINTSQRLLVTHLTDLQNNGTMFGETARKTLLKWGHLPYVVHEGRATVHIRLNNPSTYTVWALSVGGRRLEKVSYTIDGNTLTFKARVRSAYGARMLYELTTDKEGVDPDAESFRAVVSADSQMLNFSKPFLFNNKFAYKGWEKTAEVTNSTLIIKADNSQGGTGYQFHNGLDLSESSTSHPILHVVVENGNKANEVKIMLTDSASHSSTFVYDLSKHPKGRHLALNPNGDATISDPNSGSVDILDIRMIQILGNWSSNAVDLTIQGITLEDANKKGNLVNES